MAESLFLSDIKGGGRGIRPSTPKKGRPKARL